MTADHVAIEHLIFRRASGWSFADCRAEAMLIAAMHGFPDPKLTSWDELADLLAWVWCGLNHGRMA